MVIAALVMVCVPAAAQTQVEVPAWGARAVVERVIGWIGGWWTAVAGSEAEPPPGNDETVSLPEGPGDAVTTGDPLPVPQLFPELDPHG
jgi:hypothetical protein